MIYTLAAIAILWLTHRFVCPLSRAAAAFLFFLPFLLVGHALIANRVYAPIDKIYLDIPLSQVREQHGIGAPHNPATADIFSQMIPWRHAVRESFARGEWPLWNPYILSGDILAAAAQPAPYSPFTLLALLMPAPLSFTFTAAITFLVAAAGAFAFARDVGCRELTASIAAIGYTFSTAVALYVLWPLGLSWALFPLVMLGARRASFGLLTTAFTLLLLAGHPESVLHIVVIGAIYGAFEVRSWRAVGRAIAAGVVALLLCAIALLPYFEALPQSSEYEFRKTWQVRAAKPEQVALTLATDVFPFLHLRKWVDPAIGGMRAETAAVGSIILALAIYAVWRVRSRTTWFFAGLTIVMLLLHAGWGPLARLVHALPLFDISINERLGFAAAFALAILAALGAEHLHRRAATITFAIVLVFLAAVTFYITRRFVIEAGPRDWGKFTMHAELVGLGLAAVIVAMRTRYALHAFVALLLVQRVLSVGGVHKSFPRQVAYPPMKIFEPMKNVREPFRIAGVHWALLPGTNALYGLEDVRGYEAMTFHPYARTYPLWSQPQPVFFNSTDDLSKPFLSMLNVRFAFAYRSTAVPAGWREVAREGEAVLLENANVLGRAFVPQHVTVGMQSDVALDQMSEVRDFREHAWITADAVPYERANGPGQVTNFRRTRNGYSFEAEMQHDGWVVISNCAWKGWRAYVDGKRTGMQRANVAFLGVHVGEGKHDVRLVYWPQSFVVGRAVSLVTLIMWSAATASRRFRSRQRRAAAPARDSSTLPQ